MRLARLDDVSLVTQAAMNALNPVMRIEDQIIDGLEDHGYEKSKSRVSRHRSTRCWSMWGWMPAWRACFPTS